MTVKVGIPAIEINSWREFEKEVEIHNEREWIYRGQSDSDWELKSSFHRLFERLEKIFRDGGIRDGLPWRDRHERKLLDSFRYKAHLFIKDLPRRDPDYNIECLSIMQHHGTPTRLLDMTFSPYVAAFFALEEGEKDSAVFAVKHNYFRKFDENRFGKNEYKKKCESIFKI